MEPWKQGELVLPFLNQRYISGYDEVGSAWLKLYIVEMADYMIWLAMSD